MTSLIIGSTQHTRFSPKNHQFNYPLYMIDVDLNNLDCIDDNIWFFSYNYFNILSLFDSDYLQPTATSLRKKIQPFVDQLSQSDSVTSIRMIAIPRFFSKTFRPVSFYICYNDNQQIVGMIAEVTNTYKETHLYCMDGHQGTAKTLQTTKTFHVSPFFKEEGTYHFNIKNTDKSLDISITYKIDDSKIFFANFSGKKHTMTTYTLLKVIAQFPLTLFLVWPRIMWQAFLLYFKKKLPAFSKPAPPVHNMIRTMTLTLFQKRLLKLIKRLFNTHSWGCLTLTLPDNSTHDLGQDKSQHSAFLNIRNTWFFKSIKKDGEIGLGESYMKGEWDSPDVGRVIEFLIKNKSIVEKKLSGNIISRTINMILHRLRKNTLLKSKENIANHYDLGNDFYSLFLDETKMYSSGIFKHKDDTLKQSQMNKVDALISQLNVKSSDHILEIGTGWGYAAITLAKQFGCQVTSITLSKEQFDYATTRVKNENLSDKISIQLIDYRDLTGQFDGIISIEMIEAVGHEYLGTYFKQLNRLLKPGGRVAIQAITYPDKGYDTYRKSSDFIRKHIFPGGHLPSLKKLQQCLSDYTSFKEVHRLNIAESYAKTLDAWKTSFIHQKDTIRSLGFDDVFYRKWIYYFAYCKAAFKTHYLGCYQLIYQKD